MGYTVIMLVIYRILHGIKTKEANNLFKSVDIISLEQPLEPTKQKRQLYIDPFLYTTDEPTFDFVTLIFNEFLSSFFAFFFGKKLL